MAIKITGYESNRTLVGYSGSRCSATATPTENSGRDGGSPHKRMAGAGSARNQETLPFDEETMYCLDRCRWKPYQILIPGFDIMILK